MPPRRKSHAAKPAPQAAAPDRGPDPDDPDAAALVPAVAPPPARSNDELNLLVLRRWYPSIQSIVAIAPFAVVYAHELATRMWEETETRGTLFVCRLHEHHARHPTYRAIVLNRKGPENWTYDITSHDNIDFTDVYVIVQRITHGESQVFGIWIYSDGETVPDTRQTVCAAISDCATRAEEYAAQSGGGGAHGEEHAARCGSGGTHGEECVEGCLWDHGAFAPRDTEACEAPRPSHTPREHGQRIELDSLFAQPPSAPPSAQQNALLDLFKR